MSSLNFDVDRFDEVSGEFFVNSKPFWVALTQNQQLAC
jgi:hypothetical protein